MYRCIVKARTHHEQVQYAARDTNHAKSSAPALHPFYYKLLPLREGVIERHLPHSVGAVQVSTPNDERDHGRQVPLSCSLHQRCLLLVHRVTEVWLCAELQQDLDGINVTSTRDDHERRSALAVRRLCLRSVLEQELQQLKVERARRHQQRCAAVQVACLEVDLPAVRHAANW